jgi:hypothetical protein
MVGVPLQTKDLVNSLGSSAEVISSQVGQLGDGPLDKLKKLRSAYTVPTASIAKYQAAADRSSDLPPFGFNPHPRDALASLAASVGATYYREQVSPHPTAGDPFPALLDRHSKRGQMLAMAIHRRNDLRMSVERIAVGRVLPDGRNDGVITIETGKRAQAMNRSAMVGDEIEELAKKLSPAQLKKFLEIYSTESSFGPFGLFTGGLEGTSFDGSSREADDFTINQAAEIGTSSSDPSSGLDVDILKLKRMIDKRSQATDLYSQTLTAYNNIAKNIIDKARA